MDREIKRLLKLDKNPYFKMTAEENKTLEEWKKAQKPVEIKPRKTSRRKKTTNEVKELEKETGEIENIFQES